MSSLLSYGKQHIDDEDISSVVDVLKSDYLTQGPTIKKFERSICDYTGAKYCVAVANGTAALHLAVAALELKKGLEGITSPNTFVASANAFAYCGLEPKFADIDTKTYCIDPDEIEKKISKKTKVLIPVHFAGQPADMEAISEIAKEKNLYVIEDAAHAIGSKYANGQMVGSNVYSDMTTFSFHPVKTITTAEGGAITTNDELLYKKLLLYRTHGITKNTEDMAKNPGPWYNEMHVLGFNYRLSDIHAALGLSQMKKIDRFIMRRREIVDQYNKAFSNQKNLTPPHEVNDIFSAFHLYVLKINFNALQTTRKEFMEALLEKNISAQVHYIPVPTQPYYKKMFGYKAGDFPKAEAYYEQALSLPLYPDLTEENISHIITTILSLIS